MIFWIMISAKHKSIHTKDNQGSNSGLHSSGLDKLTQKKKTDWQVKET